MSSPSLRLCCVVHRFGADIAGGSEGHCRAVAERLATRHDVTILTTTAKDHVSWRNEYPAGQADVGRLHVHRFPVVRQRRIREFAALSEVVFAGDASPDTQIEWFRRNGPEVPDLLAHLETHGHRYDLVLFWSFRYYQSFFGVPIVADRAVLVPTAEEDLAIRIGALKRFFSRPAGMVYLTPEEQVLVERQVDGRVPPSCIIGCGLEPPAAHDRAALAPVGVTPPYVLYLGRIDPNKGCETLVRFYMRWADRLPADGGSVALRHAIPLVMAGPPNMPIPSHPALRALGYVDAPVREALLGEASLLVVPSPYESLSMVLLEAWNHAVPALVNARCRVLEGQARRAGGALAYRNYDEFAVALDRLLRDVSVARQLGAAGRAYVDETYRWPHVMETLERFLVSLRQPVRFA
ncbi:MAG: glycosyltransferase family 4 protein [Acidimicrobiia bacterium]|nr:glycosyltransferase family 4 protein [Acidimicrobiia bacterium]